MEFKEFSNPEGKDYDILSSRETKEEKEVDYSLELANLIGILEDVSEADLKAQYGITLEEYYHPTPVVIAKVKMALENVNDAEDIKQK